MYGFSFMIFLRLQTVLCYNKPAAKNVEKGVRSTMASVSILPENYRQIFSADMQNDEKKAMRVNVLSGVIVLAMAVPMHFHVPFFALFDLKEGLPALALRLMVLLGAVPVYMVLHELVHGIAMKAFGTKKVNYGFTGVYAFAASDDYYDKTSYIIIALAPVVLWGIVLAVINMKVPQEWFWVVYLVQITNISGAAGDLYVTAEFFHLPKVILVRDWGVRMAVYAQQAIAER